MNKNLQKVRFGVVGTNFITDWLIAGARQDSRFELAAVCSRRRETADAFAARHGIPHAFTSIEEMAASPLVDAVYIASPNFAHAEQSILCMRHGKHVLCEKPLASNAAEARLMAEASARCGVTLMEAMKAACEAEGAELITASVANSAEVRMAAQSIIDRVDAMYVATDNTVISAIASLSEVCSSNNVPLFSSDTTSSFGTEVLMAGGFDYYQSGRLTGEIIKRVLDGEKPEDIGTVYLDKLEIYINLDVAEKLGISIPDDIITDAVYIIENGSEITK